MGKHGKSDKKHKKHHHKKRKRHDSSSSSSSSESGGDSDMERKRQKSEKYAQRVVAHLQKGAGGKGGFVWGKKVEKELSEGKKLKEISAFQDKQRAQERLDELEKVRKRQAEREEEKARREEELTMVQRMRAAQEAMESETKEEEFYLKALLDKAERRLSEGRPHPSDLIARNLHAGLRLGEPADLDMKEPWSYFNNMHLDDVEALYEDIREYATYDKYDPLHLEFWKSLLQIAEHELTEARNRNEIDQAHLRGGPEAAAAVAETFAERGLHPDVERDIAGMLAGQSHGELIAMEESVSATLASGEGDMEYWEAVLKRLKIQKAKAHVRELQSQIVSATLQQLAKDAAELAEDAEVSGSGSDDDHTMAGGEQKQAHQAKQPITADQAVPTAMRWAKEDRGVVRAEGGVLPGAEEIPLDEDTQEGPSNQAEGTEGGKDALAVGEAEKRGGGAVGPAPASRIYPTEIPGPGRRRPKRGQEEQAEEVRQLGGEDELPDEIIADGRLSPPPLDPRSIAKEDVVHEEDDYRQLELMRQQVMLATSAAFQAARSQLEAAGGSTADRSVRSLLFEEGRVGVHPMMRHVAAGDGSTFRAGIPESLSAEDEMTLAQFKASSLKQMGADQADRDFGGEVPLESQVYWWHDKYKPRKPKYFNRVHTGYEWSKYNQTHYDYDNPPPKVVQGYKFNILYHDLIDKSKAPQYVIEEDPQSADRSTCILRFKAGPPYEDIAFRIVRKEWNYARKHGFRCSFERGILHLFFNFKRARYRR
mmetsp:Transcript_6513/g.15636  ORF Transcript_6513/g.15636 Transcript_6513/m.15636 type:complete len:764 (-) Transcript_6513:141-2432(-)